jgi:hypothetical protein
MKHIFLKLILILISINVFGQADNEIQVYASPTIQPKWTIFELHSNYTFTGSKILLDPKAARWTNETLEITYGVAKNFEIGFYTFSGFSPSGKFHYLGNQVRPRVTVPLEWKWPVGASLSMEFGFFRPDKDSSVFWQGEIRPIFDKLAGKWYFSFNPNVSFVLTGKDKQLGLTPQFKTVYTIRNILGVGAEYYSFLGTFRKILPIKGQEHLLGPMIDVYFHPMWELNAGMLFGLTENSNQRIIKVILGRRIGK